MKLGSLFDGSGGFPLAASLCGIMPVWASEVEPYPIAVTRSRFQNMKHLGDISRVNGSDIEPVDIITFGSPCQDLSVAGKQAGLKHENKGDDETTRSGLFMEAVRIIKEMRNATNGLYPTFAIWENVPGAFSSNEGEDFINGRKAKYYTANQIRAWYDKLHTDSAEYKMWGNGIALPCALYVMQGIADALARE